VALLFSTRSRCILLQDLKRDAQFEYVGRFSREFNSKYDYYYYVYGFFSNVYFILLNNASLFYYLSRRVFIVLLYNNFFNYVVAICKSKL